VLVIADESIKNGDDIKKFDKFIDGSNIKIEKTGGLREAIKAIQVARDLKKIVKFIFFYKEILFKI